MPRYSMAVDTGSDHYMTVREADNAQEAMRDATREVEPDAERAAVEILDVLAPGQELPGVAQARAQQAALSQPDPESNPVARESHDPPDSAPPKDVQP